VPECKRETKTQRGGESGEIFLREMEEIQHFSHEEHPLMFVEEFENDEKIQVIVCSGCDKSVCGPTYKCSHCNFFLHKSCAELPREIHHPLHPYHTLSIRAPARNSCDACRKSCERCFFYRCNRCDFDIDIECASSWLTNTKASKHFSHNQSLDECVSSIP
jgi:hypothetical protein